MEFGGEKAEQETTHKALLSIAKGAENAHDKEAAAGLTML